MNIPLFRFLLSKVGQRLKRTNGQDAAQLRFSPEAGETWTAEGLLYARAGEAMRSAFVTVNFQESQKPPATICSQS